MKKIVYLLAAAMLAALSCQKLQYPEPSSDKSLTALKCFIYYDPEQPALRQELDLLSGIWNKERHLISFVFPQDARFTEASYSRCRIEATISPTAVLEMTDAAGKGLGHGFDGFYDLSDATLYFTITAADGSVDLYQLSCKKK